MSRRSRGLGPCFAATGGLALSVVLLTASGAVASAPSASRSPSAGCPHVRVHPHEAWPNSSRVGAFRPCDSPSISRVTFRGGPADPVIIVYGRHFGARPAADPSGGTRNFGACGPIEGRTGDDFGSRLWLEDRSQLWSAGYAPYVDCLGLILGSFSADRIVYRLGSFYKINYRRRNGFSHGIYELSEGDTVTVTVKGATLTTRVRYDRTPHRRRPHARARRITRR